MVENPMVRDALWTWNSFDSLNYPDEDEFEKEFYKVDITIDVSKLSEEESDKLGDKIYNSFSVCVEYDEDENEIYITGELEELDLDKLYKILDGLKVEYTEKIA